MFPNDITPGITNQAPYKHPTNGNSLAPYIEVADPVVANSCQNTALRRSNLARIDFIPANVDQQGGVITPVTPGKYLVTYYARRYDPTKDYEPVNNPILLYRAQSPIRDDSGVFMDGGDPNVDTSSTRYSSPACSDRGSLWLYQSERNEPIGLLTTTNSEPASGSVPASSVRAIPLGVSLTTPQAGNDPPNYTPLTTFTLTDSNDDGKLDQVKINLALEAHNTASTNNNNNGEQPKAQTVRMSTTVDLPNIM
jgi:hypothetical protein